MVADVDGTLVERGGDILPEVEEAVAAFRARGGVFTLATGRPTDGARHYVQHLNLDVPVIVFNGAVVYDYTAGETRRRRSVGGDLARRALELCRDYPLDAFLYGDSEIFVVEKTARVEAYMRKDRVDCVPVGDLVAHFDRSCLEPPKLLFFGEVDDSVRLMKQLRGEGFMVNFVQSSARFIELLPVGVSKGDALAWLAAHLGIPLERVLAIGDHHNDLQLLRRAGLGVAVANAEPEVRACAGLVTRAPRGLGVAEVLAALT